MRQGICDILRERMMAYIEPRNESVSWLSQRVSLPYSSVYRIISREAHDCTFRNAYQILKVVAPDEAKAILIEYFPAYLPLLEQDKNFVENEGKQDKALDLTLKTKMFYLVHCMASTTLGTSRSEVKKCYGSVGIEALDTLLEQEVLAECRDGVVKDILFDTVQTNENHLEQMIRYNLTSFHALDKASGIFNQVEGYSDAGIEAMKTIFLDTYVRIFSLRNDPANIGHKCAFFSTVMGPFDAKLQASGENQVPGHQVRKNDVCDRYKLDDRGAAAVAGLVHDMRRPFDHVIGFLEEQEKTSEISEELKRAKNAAYRVERMLDALRRMEGEEIVSRQNEMFYLDSILDLADCYCWDYKKSFTFSGQKEFGGYIDSEKLDRCLQNLLTNAFEAACSAVRLECIRNRDSIRFMVSDDGPGVPYDSVSQLFSRGFSHGKADGTGLGLANVRAVAEGHQGEALYERKSGQTVFTVILRNVFPDPDLEIGLLQSAVTLNERLECSEIQEHYFTEALQDKPILFLSCQDSELLISLRSAMGNLIPTYHISTSARDLWRAWIVCVDDPALALRANESEVHKVWVLDSKFMAYPAFMASLIRLADKELPAFLAKKQEWINNKDQSRFEVLTGDLKHPDGIFLNDSLRDRTSKQNSG